MSKEIHRSSGQFEFIAKRKTGDVLNGILKWTAEHPDNSSGNPRYNCNISIEAAIQDVYAGSVNRQVSGHISIDDIDKLDKSGSAQQDLLTNYINYCRRKFLDSFNIYSDMKFVSKLFEDRIENGSKVFHISTLRMTIYRAILGDKKMVEFSRVNNPKKNDIALEKRNISKKYFQIITTVSGTITAILCIFLVELDMKKISIALFASITAWAAREAILAEKIEDDDSEYSYQRHWRGSIWKLIGYISTAMVSITVLSGIHVGFSK